MTGDNQSVSYDVTAIQEAKLIRTTLKPKHLPQKKTLTEAQGVATDSGAIVERSAMNTSVSIVKAHSKIGKQL